MYPHPIRLRGPWQCEGIAPPLPARSLTMPAGWDTPGYVRFSRRFGYPGQIDSDERVWLTLADLTGPCTVSLNGTLLAETASASAWLEIDGTSLLQPRNELRLEMACPGRGEQPWTEVALEVRCLAFLRGIQVEAFRVLGRLEVEVRGEVVGAADQPLDLYVIVGRCHAGQQRVQPQAEGQPFCLRCRDLPPQCAADRPVPVQIDLVNRATVWYTLTRQLA